MYEKEINLIKDICGNNFVILMGTEKPYFARKHQNQYDSP